jgi:hypothetical protein
MKKTMIAVLVVAVLLVTAGVVGSIVTNNNFGNRFSYDGTNYSGRGMMQSGDSDQIYTGEKMGIEALEERVESYLDQYANNLVISDIFVFEDSDYYFSIMEEDTGLGAMELLVNPYTGDVYPEFGPNIIWNLKYGMHNNSGYGMMGRRGMMGRNNMRDYPSANASDKNEISRKDAHKLASEYLDKNSSNEDIVSEDGHEFYGYYTFHIEDGNNTVGMLSVNGFTGEVLFHDWHGTVTQIIDGHNENDDH